MIAFTSGNRSSCHSYLENSVSCNRDRSHGDPANNASVGGKPKSVDIGNNRYPISIIWLDEVLDISWRKKSVGSLSGGHSVSYLITLVDNKVPMDTYSALKYAEKQILKVMIVYLE